MKLEEERKNLHLDLNKFAWIEMRKILWRHRISPQEFFSYLVKLLITGDNRLYQLLEETKLDRAKLNALDLVHTDEESLYAVIEQLRKKSKEG